MPRVFSALVLTCALGPVPVVAQTDTLLASAAATLTAAGLARHLNVLLADSLHGRDTPSRELELTAQYVSEEFRQLGLQPFGNGLHGGDSWFQRYPLPGTRKLDPQAVSLRFAIDSSNSMSPLFFAFNRGIEDKKKSATVSFSGGARFEVDTISEPTRDDFSRLTFLVAGPHTKASLAAAMATRQKSVILYVPPPGLDSAATQAILAQLVAFSSHVVLLPNEDSAPFAARRQAVLARAPAIIDTYMRKARGVASWVVSVQSDSLAELLSAAGINVDQVRGSPVPLVRQVPYLRVLLDWTASKSPSTLRAGQVDTAPLTAPNVVALLPGTGRTRVGQSLGYGYIVITAHMDRRGAAGDNAAGVATLLELARVFSQPGIRPWRSILFLVTSGSERNFMGSSFWTNNNMRFSPGITLNLDNIGRDARGAVAIDGLDDIEFAKRPEWVAAAHPELGLEIVNGGSVANAQSDHVSFVRQGLQALYLHDPATADSAGSIQVDQLARVARFIFYLGHDLGTKGENRGWSPSGRQRMRALMFGE